MEPSATLRKNIHNCMEAVMTLREKARRFAEDGWGLEPGWDAAWDAACDPDVVLHFCGTRNAVVGLEANKAFNKSLFEGFPDIRQDITGLIADDDEAAYRHDLTGCHLGEFLGIPPTGRMVQISGMTWLKFRQGRVVEMTYELNHAELARQLGLDG
jgi:steroid delta-isomerase-like uncharacterized protein